MRVKTLWTLLPLPDHLKLAYTRLTLTRYTTLYFVTAVILCVIQVALRLTSHSLNAVDKDFLTSIMVEGDVEMTGFPILRDDGLLSICDALPTERSDACWTLLPTPPDPSLAERSLPHITRALKAEFDPFTLNLTSVTISNPGQRDIVLSPQCVVALHYPRQMLRDALREDLTFVGYHIWLLTISIVLILNESLPHILAAVATELLATVWSGFQFVRTRSFGAHYKATVVDRYCDGVNLLPNLWNERLRTDIPVVVVDAVALFVMAFLSFKLFRVFGAQSFDRVGRSTAMKRAYMLVLTFSGVLQIAALFIFISMALWIDDLFDANVAPFALHMLVYKIVSVSLLILVVPWLIMGWIVIRRELRSFTLIFIGACILFIGMLGGMFGCPLFRYSFMTWTLFLLLNISGFVLLAATLILAVCCMVNFRLGLSSFLKRTSMDDRADKVPWTFSTKDGEDLEKAGASPFDSTATLIAPPSPSLKAQAVPEKPRRIVRFDVPATPPPAIASAIASAADLALPIAAAHTRNLVAEPEEMREDDNSWLTARAETMQTTALPARPMRAATQTKATYRPGARPAAAVVRSQTLLTPERPLSPPPHVRRKGSSGSINALIIPPPINTTEVKHAPLPSPLASAVGGRDATRPRTGDSSRNSAEPAAGRFVGRRDSNQSRTSNSSDGQSNHNTLIRTPNGKWVAPSAWNSSAPASVSDGSSDGGSPPTATVKRTLTRNGSTRGPGLPTSVRPVKPQK